MALSLTAVDRLFDRLSATYGRQFIGVYEGLEPSAIKTLWAHELDGFANRLGDIAWALENLPERAPNVIEFRNLCRRAPRSEADRLPEPPADPKMVRAELAKLKPILDRAKHSGPRLGLDWARSIVRKKEAGGLVSPLPLKMAREALARASRGEVD